MSPKVNISKHVTKYNPLFPIAIVNFSHEYKCYIITYQIVKDKIKHIYTIKQGSTKKYIKRLYERHKVGLLMTSGYQFCGNGSYYITVL